LKNILEEGTSKKKIQLPQDRDIAVAKEEIVAALAAFPPIILPEINLD